MGVSTPRVAKPRKKAVAWRDALQSALHGGVPGAGAMALQARVFAVSLLPRGTRGFPHQSDSPALPTQILLFCWLRTISHYQQVKGGSLWQAAGELWQQGVDSGSRFPVLRFYQGVFPALLQGPLCRFGDTAANEGVLSLTAHTRAPLLLRTALGTLAACSWRALLTPLDTIKLLLEVEGMRPGLAVLRRRVVDNGAMTLFAGATGVGITAAASHLPWFWVNNMLQTRVPAQAGSSRARELWRQAFIGFVATLFSDICANPMRVLKATVQTSAVPLTYAAAMAAIVEADGPGGLFTRGLVAKIMANAMQGVAFSVFWKLLMDAYARKAPAGHAPLTPSVGHAFVDLEAPHSD